MRRSGTPEYKIKISYFPRMTVSGFRDEFFRGK